MPDNIESRMSFIIEQQAQFAVDIQLLKERQADSQRQVDANREMIRQLVDVTMSLARHGEETDRRLRELAEAGAHTEHRLDALIDTVDKLVRRNGS
jgi:ABC-type transporter Mla subunit MlaD